MKDRRENCLTDKKPSFYKKREMAVDYSSPAQIPGIRWGRDTLDLHDYTDGLIYGTNGLLDLKIQKNFLRQTDRPEVSGAMVLLHYETGRSPATPRFQTSGTTQA